MTLTIPVWVMLAVGTTALAWFACWYCSGPYGNDTSDLLSEIGAIGVTTFWLGWAVRGWVS